MYSAYDDKMFVNRGFFGGPVCPIYGLCVLGVVTVLEPLKDTWFTLFAVSIVTATLIELVGGWVLDRVFHKRWWDYRKRRFNFRGYICLRFSLVWGITLALVVRFLHPSIMFFVKMVPFWWSVGILSVFSLLLAADIIHTFVNLKRPGKKLPVIYQMEWLVTKAAESFGMILYIVADAVIRLFFAFRAKILRGKNREMTNEND